MADTINDAFNTSTGCWYSTSSPYTNCDVIGNQAWFDIQKADVAVSQGWIDVTLYFNYGGGQTLAAFPVGSLTLSPGDLFFYDPANPQLQFAVALVNRPGIVAGNLYALNQPPLTAFDVLHDSNDYYRRDQPVWMRSGSTLVSAGTGVPVIDLGLSDVHAEYAALLHIPTPADAFWNQVTTTGRVGLVFESADCANDVLAGVAVVSAPEPDPISLFGIGFGILAGVTVWRGKTRRSSK